LLENALIQAQALVPIIFKNNFNLVLGKQWGHHSVSTNDKMYLYGGQLKFYEMFVLDIGIVKQRRSELMSFFNRKVQMGEVEV